MAISTIKQLLKLIVDGKMNVQCEGLGGRGGGGGVAFISSKFKQRSNGRLDHYN